MVASSRPDLIDPALLRPGRIEKHIFVGLPTVEDRVAIMLHCLERDSSSTNVSDEVRRTLQHIAHSDKTQFMTPADLRSIVSTANLIAAHEHIDSMRSSMFISPTTSLHLSSAASETSYDSRSSSNNHTSIINSSHLRKAFAQSRPSISAEDMAFYNKIYRNFRPDEMQATAEVTKMDFPVQKVSLK